MPVDDDVKEIFLGLFSKNKYKALDYGLKHAGTAVFTDMEPEIIYFAITPSDDGYRTCSMPFMPLSDGSVHLFEPDTLSVERVRLTRKYPLRFNNIERLASVAGLHFQTSDSPNGPWIDLHTVEKPAVSSFYRITSAQPMLKYLRVAKMTQGYSSISEIVVSYDSLGQNQRKLRIVNEAEIRDGFEMLIDGNTMTGTILKQEDEPLILTTDDGTVPEFLYLVPANDDNFVLPKQTYELLYFSSEGWKSLGIKMAKGFDIEFEAPRNAVLLLRNLSKGEEEQVFVWRDGRQFFNVDLRGQSSLFNR